jgi:sulfite reductase (NADPH) flavoprotein alpha-component
MQSNSVSGISSPLSSSSSTTLSSPPSPQLKGFPLIAPENGFNNPRLQASNIIEIIASRSASTIYVYDLAEQVGFGALTKSFPGSVDEAAAVISLQTRAGAGLSLVGRLSEGSSEDALRGAVLTAYTTPSGLSVMGQSLTYLPSATPNSRLVIQVPTVTPVGETLAFSPTLAPLANVLPTLPENIVVLLSATPQESVDLTALSYNLTNSHVIHLFDHHSSSREVGNAIVPPATSINKSILSVPEQIRDAGYTYFDYAGDAKARTVIVILNGPLALAAKALATRVPGLGVLIVRVLRPWDASALLEALPSYVQELHVLDDVPNTATLGSLYADVFGSLLDIFTKTPAVHSHRITPSRTHNYLTSPASFYEFIISVVPGAELPAVSAANPKKLLFFSTPGSSLSPLSHVIEDTFLRNQAISARLLTSYDNISKPGGITADRILLSQKSEYRSHVPIPIELPIAAESQGESDFLAILDHNLLKSHTVVDYAKPGSAVLVATPWSVEELTANLPREVAAHIADRNLRVHILDAKGLASKLAGGPAQEALQNLIVHLAFLRLYLGKAATEALVLRVARLAFEDTIHGIELLKINAHAWSGLTEVEIKAESAVEGASAVTLKTFEFNAISVDIEETSNLNGAKLSSWHDAAKHILFPSVYTPTSDLQIEHEQYSQDPALRPEVPDRTFLVTTTVNRRLTPLEYDRNVFHLEFDTSGTGLKYAIGEALGVHGWNDEEDVLDFCKWYGVHPERLVTIPINTAEGKMHTRTVFQALQQQVDLFGKPGKSFYTDLAAYATKPSEKYALLFIGSPEGSSTFKKMSEVDTVTFADVMKQFPSAKPGIETLCEIIGDIKPRHYSIASAQSVVGDRVDLLVVSVDWQTPNGNISAYIQKYFPHAFFRNYALRSVHKILGWPPHWAEGHCLNQA